MSQRILTIRCDLDGPLQVTPLQGVMGIGDRYADIIRVLVYRGEEYVTLTGSIVGYVINAAGATFLVNGTSDGNGAQIQLPQEAYEVAGPLTIVIREVVDTVITDLIICTCTVKRTVTGTVYDPGDVIPEWDDVVAKLEAMDEATDAANAAAAAVPSMIASTFSTSTSYVAGQTVYYDGHLYRFVADHAAGSWTGSDVTMIVLGDEVGGAKSEINAIKNAISEYADPDTNYFSLTTGGISSQTGASADGAYATTRRRTLGYTDAPDGSVVSCEDTYTICPFFYNTQSTSGYVGSGSYVGNSYTIDKSQSTYVRLVFKRADGTAFSDGEYPTVTFIERVQRLDVDEARLDTIEYSMEDISALTTKTASNQFVNGGYNRRGGEFESVTIPYYLISTLPVSDHVAVARVASGYKITAVSFATDGSWAGFLTAKDTFTTTSTSSTYWAQEISFRSLREKYPYCSFRLEMATDSTASGTRTEITPAAESNVTFALLPGDAKPQRYYATEMETTIQSVRDALTEPALVFPMVTDIHYLSENNSFDYCIDNIKAFCKAVRCDFVANLGDNTDGDTAQATTLQRNEYMIRRFAEIGLPYLFAIGNHDTNYKAGTSAVFSELQIFKSYYSNTNGVVFDMTAGENNFYKDFDELGIRVIFLDANHPDLEADPAVTAYSYTQRTATWLTEVALVTNHVVVLCEHLSSIRTMNWEKRVLGKSNAVNTALEGFVNGGGTLIQLCGHSHADYSFSTPWLAIFSTCQKFYQADVTGSGYQQITDYNTSEGITSPARTLGTASEDAWNVVVIKPLSKVVNVIRFGAGNDRTYSFGS